MRKVTIYTTGFSVMAFALLSNISYAQVGSGGSGCPSGSFCNPFSTITTFADFVNAILDIVIMVGTPVIVLAIMYAGFMFVTAQGNEEKLRTAKRAFTWAIVGAAVLLGSKVIAGAIETTVGAL